MNLMFIWLLGSVIVALDIFNTLYDDSTAKFKYENLDFAGKIAVLIQLSLLCFLGSWLIIILRLGTYLYFNYFKRRK